ncbi:hypothetical protein V8E53_007537 [Lactarius tabidus]
MSEGASTMEGARMATCHHPSPAFEGMDDVDPRAIDSRPGPARLGVSGTVARGVLKVRSIRHYTSTTSPRTPNYQVRGRAARLLVDAGKGQKPRSPCTCDAGVGGAQRRQGGTDVAFVLENRMVLVIAQVGMYIHTNVRRMNPNVLKAPRTSSHLNPVVTWIDPQQLIHAFQARRARQSCGTSRGGIWQHASRRRRPHAQAAYIACGDTALASVVPVPPY